MAGLCGFGTVSSSRFLSSYSSAVNILCQSFRSPGRDAQDRDSYSWFVFGRRARASSSSLARIDTTLWVRYSAFQMSWPRQDSSPHYSCSGLSHTECFSDEQVSPFPVNQISKLRHSSCSKRFNRFTPSLILPRDRGGGKRWGLELLERLERFEPKLRDLLIRLRK